MPISLPVVPSCSASEDSSAATGGIEEWLGPGASALEISPEEILAALRKGKEEIGGIRENAVETAHFRRLLPEGARPRSSGSPEPDSAWACSTVSARAGPGTTPGLGVASPPRIGDARAE